MTGIYCSDMNFRFNLLINWLFRQNLVRFGRELDSSLKVTGRPKRWRAEVLRVVDESITLIHILHFVHTLVYNYIYLQMHARHIFVRAIPTHMRICWELFSHRREMETQKIEKGETERKSSRVKLATAMHQRSCCTLTAKNKMVFSAKLFCSILENPTCLQ